LAFDGRIACQVLGSNLGTERSEIRVLSADEAARRLQLDAAEEQVLAEGGMLVTSGKQVISAGQVTVLRGRQRLDGEGYPAGRVRQADASRLHALALPAFRFAEAFPGWTVGAVVTPATARAQHWPTWVDRVELRAPDGGISTDAEDAIEQQLGQDAYLYVERGYRSEAFYVFLGMFVLFGLLVLVATLISTALAQAEGRADLATLAAVGAGSGLRRAVASAQAFVVGLVGAVLGLVIGFVPGIAVTWPLTVNEPGRGYGVVVDGVQTVPPTGPIIVIPWLWLTAVVVGVPLLAAALAASATRRAPEATRRSG
jgi:putative ABC transport system permease protein